MDRKKLPPVVQRGDGLVMLRALGSDISFPAFLFLWFGIECGLIMN